MIKIAFFDTEDYDKKLFDEYNKTYNYQITYLKSRLNAETAPLAKGYDVVCIFVNDKADKETLDILNKCGVKLLALRCAGFNNVDLKHLGNIRAVRVPQYSPYAVAEHATALLLNINRKIYKSYQRVKKYNFALEGLVGFDLHGKTVGVVGTGKIGKVFIQIMKGFGTKVIAYDLFKDEKAAEELGFEYVSFDELCEKYVGKDVLVVTHAGVSIYVRCYFEGEPKDGNYNNYKLKNCEVLQYDNSRKMEKIIKDDFER